MALEELDSADCRPALRVGDLNLPPGYACRRILNSKRQTGQRAATFASHNLWIAASEASASLCGKYSNPMQPM